MENRNRIRGKRLKQKKAKVEKYQEHEGSEYISLASEQDHMENFDFDKAKGYKKS
ncbi:MAG: hypothetical protein ACK4ND_10950 [Cytophagaceae bacterium]